MTALAAGVLSLIAVAAQTAQLSSAVATGGTGPYTYQWYRSTTTGFTPGAGNIVTGATALTLNDSGLVPGTQYYYAVVATDSASATATSTQLAVATLTQGLQQNTFAQSQVAGQVDLRHAPNTISVMIDASQVGTLYPGQAVKLVDSTDGVPKVVACSAVSDNVFGFLNFGSVVQGWTAGMAAEMSGIGNCIYLWFTSAVSRGGLVQLDPATAAVTAKVGSSGAAVVGWAFDKVTAPGTLARVKLEPTGVLGTVKA